MLYSNVAVKATLQHFDFGDIYQVKVGEAGRGRKEITLTAPADVDIKIGMNPDLTIGTTRSGRPRIVRKKDNTLFMLLSSYGGYTRRGSGTIWVPKETEQQYKCIAAGNGADGDAGRIGQWDVRLIQCPPNGIVRVIRSRSKKSDLYVIVGSQVYACTAETYDLCCETLGIDQPCPVEELPQYNCAYGPVVKDWAYTRK